MESATTTLLAMRLEEMRDEALAHPGSAADQVYAQRRIDVLTERWRRIVRGMTPIVLVGRLGAEGTRTHYLTDNYPVCGVRSRSGRVRQVDDTGVAATCTRCRRFESEALR